jgi:exoribonuclease R
LERIARSGAWGAGCAQIQNAGNLDEERLDLTHLNAYAIDNAWSADPDDAVSWKALSV